MGPRKRWTKRTPDEEILSMTAGKTALIQEALRLAQGNVVVELIGIGLTAIVPLLGGVVWLVRLEGRLNVQDAKQQGTEKRIDGLEQRIFAQLDRIENLLQNKADKE